MFGKKEDKKEKEERFKVIYSQGRLVQIQILQDTETGVNYLVRNGDGGTAITVLLDKDGKPVITDIEPYK